MRIGHVRLLWLCSIVSMLVSAASWAAEGRTPVFAPGTAIASPGKYILTRNLDGNGAAPVIEISAPSVELDLNGFRVSNQGLGIGIRVNDPTNVLIRNGDIVSVGVGVDVPSAGAERVVIEDLRIYYPDAAGIRVANVNNVVVRRVLVYRSNGDGIRVDGSGNTAGAIVDSQVHLSNGVGIAVDSSASFTVLDNRVMGATLEGIRVDVCRGCRVDGNTVTGGGGLGGIYVTSMRGGSLSHNAVAESHQSGIRLGTASSDFVVRGNVSNTNSEHGLLVEAQRLTIEGNVLNDNGGVGLRFAATSVNCRFGRNSAVGNQGTGGTPCADTPPLFPPDSCNDGLNHFTFGDNLIPGPALF